MTNTVTAPIAVHYRQHGSAYGFLDCLRVGVKIPLSL
jgi:hypothetical protein